MIHIFPYHIKEELLPGQPWQRTVWSSLSRCRGRRWPKRQATCADSSLEQETYTDCFYYLLGIICQVIGRTFTFQGTMESCPFTNIWCYICQNWRPWKSQIPWVTSIHSRTKVWEWSHGHSKIHSCQNWLQIPLYQIASGFFQQKISAIKLASSFLPYESLTKCFMVCVYDLTSAQVKVIVNFFPKGILGGSCQLDVIISPTTYVVTVMHWLTWRRPQWKCCQG